MPTSAEIRQQTRVRSSHVHVETPTATTAHHAPQTVATAQRATVDAATQRSSRRAAQGHEAMARHAVMNNATLREGSHGAAVKHLQQQLNHHGAHLAVDGAFGPHTQAAVKAFQHHHHLAADGVVGPLTHAALNRSHGTHDAAPVHHAAQHGTNTVAGCANILLHSKNVTFWTGLSSGSERANFQRLARGQDAKVFATNHTGPSHVKPSLRIMQSLVEMARHGTIQINALTGGTHSFNSNHYSGHAVDISVAGPTQHDHLSANHQRSLSAGEIVAIANRHGGVRNFETDHIHLDF